MKAWIAMPSAGARGSLRPPSHLVSRGGWDTGAENGLVIWQLSVLSHAVSVDGAAARGSDRSLGSLAGLRFIGFGVGRTAIRVRRAVTRRCSESGKRFPKSLTACELRRVGIDPGSSERGEGGG